VLYHKDLSLVGNATRCRLTFFFNVHHVAPMDVRIPTPRRKKPGDQVQTFNKTDWSASSELLPWSGKPPRRHFLAAWPLGEPLGRATLWRHSDVACDTFGSRGTLMLHATLLGTLVQMRHMLKEFKRRAAVIPVLAVQLPAATADVLAVRQHLRRFTPARRCSC